MKKIISIIVIFNFLFIDSGFSLDIKKRTVVDGVDRYYFVHLPYRYKKENKMPVVFVLHGGLGNAQTAMRMTDMNSLADKEKFIVVYPNGTGRFKNRFLTWNASYNCCGYAMREEIDDVKFINKVIEEIKNDYNVDKQRIYVSGMSNGGMMSYRLACELSKKIAAIAVVAGALNYQYCSPVDTVPVIIFHGKKDYHVPFNGGVGKKSVGRFYRKKYGLEPRADQPVDTAVDFWCKNNGCQPTAKVIENEQLIKKVYDQCVDETELVLYIIKNGGHSWPGGVKLRKRADDPVEDIVATEIIWDFFSRHKKNN